MATINYLYRSTKEKAPLIIRLLFRHNETDFVFGAKTKIEVSKNYWNKEHQKKRAKDTDLINKQAEINEKTATLEAHVLNNFNNTKLEYINKEWLQTQINEYYEPPQQATALPVEVVKYIEYFIEDKRNDISINSIKKYNVHSLCINKSIE
jgi:hypothetical protein